MYSIKREKISIHLNEAKARRCDNERRETANNEANNNNLTKSDFGSNAPTCIIIIIIMNNKLNSVPIDQFKRSKKASHETKDRMLKKNEKQIQVFCEIDQKRFFFCVF